MKALICGGRYYDDRDTVFRFLDLLHAEYSFSALIEGGASGADELGRDWARARSVPVETYSADWATHGRAAGPIRNAQMLSDGKPDVVVAFPGGKGTADMLRKAQDAGLRTVRVNGSDDVRQLGETYINTRDLWSVD